MIFEPEDVEFGDRIGGGAIAIVYHGVLVENDRRVALKTMFGSDNSRRETLEELRTMSNISNQHIVALIGACTTSSRPFIVMELCEASLFHVLHQQRNMADLTYRKRLDITSHVLRGLDYLHSRLPIPIVHRDLKSRNVLLGYDGKFKLCDFGLSSIMTTDRGIVGTPAYMAPECFSQSSVLSMARLKQVDVYAFGVLAWEIIHLAVPYSTLSITSTDDLADYVTHGGRPKYDSSSSSMLKALIQSCWHQEAALRPTTDQLCIQMQEIEASSNKDRQESKEAKMDSLEALMSKFK